MQCHLTLLGEFAGIAEQIEQDPKYASLRREKLRNGDQGRSGLSGVAHCFASR
jgi:hypothetical protein